MIKAISAKRPEFGAAASVRTATSPISGDADRKKRPANIYINLRQYLVLMFFRGFKNFQVNTNSRRAK